MSTTPRSRPLAPVLFALVLGALLIVALVIGSGSGTIGRIVDSFYPPAAATDRGAAIRELYNVVFLIAAVIFFVVEGLIIWTVLRYRRRPGDDALPPQTHGNFLAEAIWTIVPTIIVAFLFVISWQTLNTVDAVSAQPDLKVRAIAGQFQWTFEYLPADWDPKDGDPTPVYTEFLPTEEGGGGMVVPVDRNIQLYLSSPDVIHAFYVPKFLYKRDVVPGRTNSFEFRLDPEQAGGPPIRGQCAELCGAKHREMIFDVVALTPADFDAWLADKIESGPASAPPSGEMGDTVLQIAAAQVAFDTAELSVPADEGFRIEFDNQDASIPHNVAIHEGSPTGPELWKGEVFPGPEKRTYEVPPLKAGTYGFVCTVHPTMTGTLTAE